ncbi:MAG: hypothetical protein JJE21_03805 [Spirochaetaceae bacterium]|nr:hypothetical protein [Spirochaetaceae bacterium]
MKYKKLLALLFATFVLFSSCTSTNNMNYVSRSPYWINGVSDSPSILNYVIVVSGSDEQELYTSACNIFVTRFVINLSLEAKSDEYLDSLINTLNIPDFNVNNSKRYIIDNGDNSYKGYFLFTASKAKVSNATATRLNLISTTKATLLKLINQSNENYRNNKDLKSFDNLVDAYILSRNSNISSSETNSSTNLMNRLLKLVRNMTISVADFDQNNLNCSISVARKVGLFPPIILDSNIKISYSSYNPSSNPYLDVEKINIPSKLTSFKFVPRNNSIYKKGVLLIEVDIDENLTKLRNSGYSDTASILEKNNKCYVISYKSNDFFANKSIKLKVLENDLNQIPLIPRSVNRIVDALESLGGTITLDDNTIDNKSTYDYQIVIRNEITDKVPGFKAVVRTAGSVEVNDLSKDMIIYNSEPFECVANGDDMESAINEVFDRFALKSIFLIKENF